MNQFRHFRFFCILSVLLLIVGVCTPANEAVIQAKESKKKVIVIDAGHQRNGNSELEPIGPGASEQKPKVSTGTYGNASGLAEYQLNLKVAKMLKKALKKEGYQVIMVRTKHDVNLSNRERAEIANQAHADVFIRIHANSSADPSVSGTLTISPTKNNPYCSEIYEDSYLLSKKIVYHVSKQTGFRNRGVWQTDTMSGINWCKVPVTILEMGFMSNPEEDLKLAGKEYQEKIVAGTVKGIKRYFKSMS